MKKLFTIFNFVFLALIVAGDICYTIFGGLWLKSLTSLMFVMLGGINLFYAIKNKTKYLKFSIWLFVGLVLAMAGDIVLNLYFIGGAILFAIGHVFFFVSYCFVQEFKWTDLIYTAIIFVPSLMVLLFVPILNYGGILMQIVCIAYALIISLMLGKAIANFVREKNMFTLIILVGCALFFFSDLMLLFDVFAGAKVAGILCLATYYPAEFLLAHSTFTGTNKGKK